MMLSDGDSRITCAEWLFNTGALAFLGLDFNMGK